MAQTIDNINDVFAKYVHENKLHEIVDRDALFTGYQDETINMEKFPLEFMLWNRNYKVIERPANHLAKKYSINYCHGHDSQDGRIEKHIFNLDNYFSKCPSDKYGEYSALYSHQIQLRPVPRMQDKHPIVLTPVETKEEVVLPATVKIPLRRSQAIPIIKDKTKEDRPSSFSFMRPSPKPAVDLPALKLGSLSK